MNNPDVPFYEQHNSGGIKIIRIDSVRKTSAGKEDNPMRLTATKTLLNNAIGIVIRAVPAHTTMPVLQCVLLEAHAGELFLTASDMDQVIMTHIPAMIEEEGIIAADAKMFSEIIRKAPSDTVTMETDDHYGIRIKSGRAKFAIGGRSGEEFPELPQIERDEAVTLSQFTLKSLINETIFSIAVNENNKIMTGELFEIRGGILRVVALDGHRIAIRRVALKERYDDRKVIVPGKTLTDTSRILTGEMDDTVNLYFTKNHILFELPDTLVISRLIDGDYFNIDQMISNDYETKVVVNRNELMGCVDRAALFVREGDRKPIIFEIEDGTMRLSIDSPLGSMDDELEIVKEGRSMAIGFNPRFMMDVLKAVTDEEITMYLINPKAPCFIRDESQSYTYLVLPVNFVR